MNVKTMMGAVVAAVIMVVLASAVLVPILSDAQKVSGATTEFENLPPVYLTELNDDLTFSVQHPNQYYTINGEDIQLSGLKQGYIVVSDAVTIQYTGALFILDYGEESYQYSSSWGNDYTVTYIDGVATIVRNTEELWSGPYTWAYARADSGEYVTGTSGPGAKVNSLDDLLCAGYYSSGENKTYYSWKDGTWDLSHDSYSVSWNVQLNPVNGTTDVYTISAPKIDIGGEVFTPYIYAVKSNIIGHEDHGANYSLIGVIPLLVFVGIVLGVAGSFIRNRD